MKHLISILTICFLTTSCGHSFNKQDENIGGKKVISHISEDPQSPFEVYNSMARAIKYNLDAAIVENNRKITTLKQAKTPKQKISIFVAPKNKTDIFHSYQNLSAAILIAKDNKKSYYKDITNSLMLAGVSAYNKAKFAKNQNLYLKRSLKSQQKELAKINQKEKTTKKLSTDDEKRKEALNLYLLKMQKLQDQYAQDIAHFNNLESLNTEYVKFGSSKYFDVKNFKPEFILQNFEHLAQENGVVYELELTKHMLAKHFPNAYRINMSEQTYKNKPLQNAITQEANSIATMLLNKKITTNEAKVLQIKLAFYIAKLTEFNSFEATQQYINAKKDYEAIKKDRTQKNKTLELKAIMIKAKHDKNNAQGTYAIAVQNLYLLTDPLNLSKNDLNRAVGIVAKNIKKYTQKNASKLMANDNYANIKKEPMPAVNKAPIWADPQTNWLENSIKDYK